MVREVQRSPDVEETWFVSDARGLNVGCVTWDHKQIFARELDEFLAEYPDWLLEMPDGSLAPVAHMTRETRSGDAVVWIVHTAEDPSRRIECVQADELLTFKRERDSSP